jgi:hypothetical protein
MLIPLRTGDIFKRIERIKYLMTELLSLEKLINDGYEITEEDVFNIGPDSSEFFIDNPEKILGTIK